MGSLGILVALLHLQFQGLIDLGGELCGEGTLQCAGLAHPGETLGGGADIGAPAGQLALKIQTDLTLGGTNHPDEFLFCFHFPAAKALAQGDLFGHVSHPFLWDGVGGELLLHGLLSLDGSLNLLLDGSGGGLDIDLIAGQLGSQTSVLTLLADGQGQLVVGDDNAAALAVGQLLHADDVSGGQSGAMYSAGVSEYLMMSIFSPLSS